MRTPLAVIADVVGILTGLGMILAWARARQGTRLGWPTLLGNANGLWRQLEILRLVPRRKYSPVRRRLN